MNRKLIEAQEQERNRIARELHDDIGQRLALLAIELDQLNHDPPDQPELLNRIDELQKQASEIATDVQTLSHDLHSAKLEYLGPLVAMRTSAKSLVSRRRWRLTSRARISQPLAAGHFSLPLPSPARGLAQCGKAQWGTARRSGIVGNAG